MPTITFRLLSTTEQLSDIERDFRGMIANFGDKLDAQLEVVTDLVPDPELVTTWVELFNDSGSDDTPPEEAKGSELQITVDRYDGGTISGLTMQFAHLLTNIEDEPAEPLLRLMKDDPGTPRVPWHVEVTR